MPFLDLAIGPVPEIGASVVGMTAGFIVGSIDIGSTISILGSRGPVGGYTVATQEVSVEPELILGKDGLSTLVAFGGEEGVNIVGGKTGVNTVGGETNGMLGTWGEGIDGVV